MTKYIGYIYFDHLDKFVVCYGKKHYSHMNSSWLFDILYLKTFTVDELERQVKALNEQFPIKWYSNALEGSLMARWLKTMTVQRHDLTISVEHCHQNLIAGIGSQVVGVSIVLKKYILDGLKNAVTNEKIEYPAFIVACGILVTLSLHSLSYFSHQE